MAKVTQKGRRMSIATPLGDDVLLIRKLVAREEMSGLFTYDVELLHEEAKSGRKAKTINAPEILGQSVTIAVNQDDGGSRTFSGIVTRFQQGRRTGRYSFYYAQVKPRVWALTQNQQNRIFQQISVPDILKKIFSSFTVSYALIGTFEKREFCVQYRESDFDFASRLMEEEGIY